VSKKVRDDAIMILLCCADKGMHGSGGWTGAIAEELGHWSESAAARMADMAWWSVVCKTFGLDHSAICLEAAAWLEDGGRL